MMLVNLLMENKILGRENILVDHPKMHNKHCFQITVVDRFSRHRFSRNPDLVENFAVTNHFYSIKIQYSRKFDLVD